MIIMQMDWPGATKQQYESLNSLLDVPNRIPEGNLLHTASFDREGMHVTDIWRSEQEFNSFVQSELMPAVGQLGIPGQPKVVTREIYAIVSSGLESASA